MKKLDAQNVREIAVRIYGQAAANSLLKQKHKNTDGVFDQPLPDVIGLKQHDGECASDSIQEVVLFADGIREYTQPILYGLTKEQMETWTTLTLDHTEWRPLQAYFHYIQKRFRAHYDVINYIRTHDIDAQKYYDKYDEVCMLNPLFKRKEAGSIEAGVLALKHYKGEKVYRGTGLTYKKTTDILDGLLAATGVPYVRENGVHLEAAGVVTFCKKTSIDEAGKETESSLGHVVGFMKAMGQWIYYDDNLGFLNVDEKVVEVLKAGLLRIVIYKKIYFVKANAAGDWVEAWSEGAWSKELVKNLYFGDKKKQGIYMYVGNPETCSSVKYVESELMNDGHRAAGISQADLKPTTVDELGATLTKFRTAIYANMDSNSKIFENMYRFLHDNVALVKASPEELDFTEKSIKSVVLRPACTPMTHYWCNKIDKELKDRSTDSLKWFKIPKINKIAHQRLKVRTPPEFLKKLAEEKQERRSSQLTPCLPGQYRNMKTLKCHNRGQRSPKLNSKGDEVKKTPRKAKAKEGAKERCAKGEVRDPKTGECVPRDPPCPPGQVRNRNTKLCRGRLANKGCPEGEVRDKKTKKCRPVVAYKF